MKETLKGLKQPLGCYSTLKVIKNSDIFRRKVLSMEKIILSELIRKNIE